MGPPVTVTQRNVAFGEELWECKRQLEHVSGPPWSRLYDFSLQSIVFQL